MVQPIANMVLFTAKRRKERREWASRDSEGRRKKRICGFAIRSGGKIPTGTSRRKEREAYRRKKKADGTRRTDTATVWLTH